MIKSIKYFLLISLLVSITLASTINGIVNYLSDEKVIEPYLDSQLVRIASLIDIISQSAKKDPDTRKAVINLLNSSQPITHERFEFQAWNQKNELVLSAVNDPKLKLNYAPFGFSDVRYGSEHWRIYATYGKTSNLKIVVAELYTLRRALVDDIAHTNANILLITYIVFGLLIWLIVNYALRSITNVTNEISSRASSYLEPVQLSDVPEEIKPLVAELNELFIRLKLAFQRNKRFAADAAHELRTPLAALKTHVQVALQVDNEVDRKKALKKVIEGVNRSSHVIAQLLTLSRLGEEEALIDVKPFDLHRLATEIIAYVAPQAIEKNIEIDLSPTSSSPFIVGNDIAVGILIRNVVDNAIRYTPERGEVHIEILETDEHVIFKVTDTGMGIPVELRERVFERFYRILGTKTSGSGLGLAIVSQIAGLHHASISLVTPENGIGLQFEVAFPKYHA